MAHLVTDFAMPAAKPKTKKAMVAYLRDHPRYNTANSWNRATSYSRCVKLHHIKFPDKATNSVAWDMVCSQIDWWHSSGLEQEMDDFDVRWDYRYQLGTNGRSGGYIVLYQGGKKPSGYKSYCTDCHQRNYAVVLSFTDSPEDRLRKYYFDHHFWVEDVYLGQSEVKAIPLTDDEKLRVIRMARQEKIRLGDNVTTNNRCGRCGADARVNYAAGHEPVETYAYPGRGLDEDEDFAEWDADSLKSRVEVVWDMDTTVERMAKKFIDFCTTHVLAEEEIMVPKTIQVARKRRG